MSDSLLTPWTVICQVPLSIGFPRQEYWSRLPFPSSGSLPDPGVKPVSPTLVGGFFTTEPPEKPHIGIVSPLSTSSTRMVHCDKCQLQINKPLGLILPRETLDSRFPTFGDWSSCLLIHPPLSPGSEAGHPRTSLSSPWRGSSARLGCQTPGACFF